MCIMTTIPSLYTLIQSSEYKSPTTVMRITGDAILPHPVGTFSNVTGNRGRMGAGEPESEQVLVVRRRTGSFRDATPSRSRVRGQILAAIFNRKSSGGTGDGKSSDLVVIPLRNVCFCGSLLHCLEALAYLFKKEPMD